jgi:hypothetical protein
VPLGESILPLDRNGNLDGFKPDDRSLMKSVMTSTLAISVIGTILQEDGDCLALRFG